MKCPRWLRIIRLINRRAMVAHDQYRLISMQRWGRRIYWRRQLAEEARARA